MSLPLDQLIQTTYQAAEQAARFVEQESKKVRQVNFKGATDLVTQADLGSEKIILQVIKEKFPDHTILTEESRGQSTESDYTWIIDPLDGTTNYVHGYPFYSISIAIFKQSTPLVGIIVDICHQHTYMATRGRGAYKNNRPIHVSKTKKLSQSLLATGFPYLHNASWSKNFEYMKKFTDITQGVRRAGSAAIDLAHVACGWLDGFWEIGLHPWDTAAGILIVKEAGGKISKMDGTDFSIYDREIVASNGILHNPIINVFTSLKDIH